MTPTIEERDEGWLDYIADSIQKIRRWSASGRTALDDEVFREAIESRLRKVAESTQRLSRPLKNSEPDIPWKRIASFRNVITHDYRKIDHDQVWNAVENHLPPLAAAVERMMALTQNKLTSQSRGQRR